MKENKEIALSQKLPEFLIIGAARCGTTWLAKNIMSHPDIFLPVRKELHYFDQNYAKGIGWYQKYFEGRTEKMLGEATPAYLYKRGVASRIRKHLPKSKLIVSLRNPVDRAYSHYLYRYSVARNHAKQKVLSFEEMLEKKPRLIEEGQYYERLKPYLNLFSAEQLLFVLFEDIKVRPEKILQDIYVFLDVDDKYESPLLDNRINTTKSQVGSSIIAMKLHKGLIRMKFSKLAKIAEKKSEMTRIPEVDIAFRKYLLETYFEADIHALEKVTGKCFDNWIEKT